MWDLCVWWVWSRRWRIQNVLWNLCLEPSSRNFAGIPMIFCTRRSLVVPECSAKFRPNAQDSSKWLQFYIKKSLLHFSPSLFCLLQQNLAGTLLRARKKTAIFRVWNKIFCTFFKLLWLLQQNLAGTLLGLMGTLSANLTSNELDRIFRVWNKIYCTFLQIYSG